MKMKMKNDEYTNKDYYRLSVYANMKGLMPMTRHKTFTKKKPTL